MPRKPFLVLWKVVLCSASSCVPVRSNSFCTGVTWNVSLGLPAAEVGALARRAGPSIRTSRMGQRTAARCWLWGLSAPLCCLWRRAELPLAMSYTRMSSMALCKRRQACMRLILGRNDQTSLGALNPF